jgi:hypothetical protein
LVQASVANRKNIQVLSVITWISVRPNFL